MERYRTTLIMVGVLIVLGALALFLNNRGTTDPTEGISTPVPVQYVWQDANPVTGIEVVSGTKRVVLELDTETTVWELIEPEQTTAEGAVVSSVADNLQNLVATRVITDAADLAAFSLADPRWTVTVTFSDTQALTRTLLVGSPTIDTTGYYVKQANDPTVYIVGYGIIEPLRSWPDAPPKSPPTPTPLPFTVAPSSTITGTGEITGTTEITGTSPGAANPTTPEATPLSTPTELAEPSPSP